MTPREFAGLPSDAQQAVWRAHSEGRVDAVPVSAGSPDGMLRYHRAQVRDLPDETEAAR